MSEGLQPLGQPAIERPSVHTYGIPETLEGTLPWSWAEARLAAAETYWVATSRPDGRPHAMPIWAAWCASRIWFEGGRLTRRARNLDGNPAISVGIELPNDGAVIVEGTAVRFDEPPDGLTGKLVAAFAKYRRPPRDYAVDPTSWSLPDGGIWAVTPRIVFGWSRFPTDATRWRFDLPEVTRPER